MSRTVVELVEPGRRPEVERMDIRSGEEFRVVWVPGQEPLRRLVLRGRTDRIRGKEAEETLLWLRAPDRSSPEEGFRVLQVGRTTIGEPETREAGALWLPIERDSYLPTRFEVRVVPREKGAKPIFAELKLLGAKLPTQGRAAGDGADVSKSFPGGSSGINSWAVPTAWVTMGNPVIKLVMGPLSKLASKLKIPPALLGMLIMGGIVLGMGAYSYSKSRQANNAEAQALEASDRAERAEEASEAAVEEAGACLEALASAQTELGEPAAVQRTEVVRALDGIRARTAVRELVSENDELERALSRAEASRPELVSTCSSESYLRELSSEQRQWAEARLSRLPALKDALPAHVLLWHPRGNGRGTAEDENLRYVEALDAFNFGGSTQRGPWGFSERAGLQFGRVDPGMNLGPDASNSDPRFRADWSAATLHDALVAIREQLLSVSLDDRLPTPPEEIHLWSLALLHAYNQMPDWNTEGGDSAACIEQLVLNVADGQTAEPGEAVLPPVSYVIEQGRLPFAVERSAPCPWREDHLYMGVELAVRSVADAAQMMSE